MGTQLLALIVAVSTAYAVDVETEYGIVRGQTIAVDDTYANSFKSIPFARAPVGELRFANPEPPEPWDDVYMADTLKMQCPQSPLGLLWMTHPGWLLYGEDCLHMNIFTPENMAGGPYPVMVWFHGGGYSGGGNIQYPGHFLAALDTVVVVPNYRLGVFGFLATPDGTLKGNAAMMDQIMALQFVQDNIANFGGDPDRVTIFGQSAGASSSALHMVSPLSEGLFHRAICESGADTNFWAYNGPDMKPENFVYQTATRNDCERETDQEIVDCLRQVPWDTLRQNGRIQCTEGFFCLGYAPIVDGDGGFLPDRPHTLREQGLFHHVDLITGICSDDGSLYTIGMIPEAGQGDGFTREEFLYYLEERLLDIWVEQITDEEADKALAAVDFYYSPWPHLDNKWNNRDAFNIMITDAAFGLPMNRQADMHSPHADTYIYVQGFRSPNASTLYAEWMGVPHNGELPYVWGWTKLLHNPAVRQDSLMVVDVVGWVDPVDPDYADFYLELWTNFARTGNPTPYAVSPPPGRAEEDVIWPKYTFDEQNYMLTTETVDILEKYRPRNHAFFFDYLSKMIDIPILMKKGFVDPTLLVEAATKLVLESIDTSKLSPEAAVLVDQYQLENTRNLS